MPRGDHDVELFHGGDGGYGNAIAHGVPSYHHAVNWDCTPRGISTPSNAPVLIIALDSITNGKAWKVASAFEWVGSTGLPRLVVAGGAGTGLAQGYLFLDASGGDFFTAAVDAFTGAAGWRGNDAGDDTPMIYLCNGSSNDNIYQVTQDGASLTNAGHGIKADGLFVIGTDFYMTQGYKVRKWTVDTDPGLAASWPTATPCGQAVWDVNKLVPLGGSPVAAKPEGLFRYNPAPSVAEFVNVLPVPPHPDNGKAAIADGRGRIYYDIVDGGIIVATFGSASQVRPTRTAHIDRDTPFGHISAFTVDGDRIYAAVEPGSLRTNAAALGIKVFVDDGGVFTDVTTNVTDGKYSTEADVTALVDGDHIYVGADVPFHGVHVEMSAFRTSNGDTLAEVEYSKGSSAWQAIGPSSSSIGAKDSTQLFLRDGLICIKDDSGSDLPNLSANAWAKDTVNSSEKYWIRIDPNAALTGAKIREVKLVPYRPPLDPDVFPISAYELTGCLPKILVGTWEGETLRWDDVWTVNSERIDQLVVGRSSGSAGAGHLALYCITGRVAVHAIPIGVEDNAPIRTPYPKLADYAETHTAQDDHLIYLNGNDFGKPTAVKRVDGPFSIDMPFIQSDDEVYLYYWWDEDTHKVEREGPLYGSPIVMNGLKGEGVTLYSAIAFKDGSRTAVAPRLHTVSIPEQSWAWQHMALKKQDVESPVVR